MRSKLQLGDRPTDGIVAAALGSTRLICSDSTLHCCSMPLALTPARWSCDALNIAAPSRVRSVLGEKGGPTQAGCQAECREHSLTTCSGSISQLCHHCRHRMVILQRRRTQAGPGWPNKRGAVERMGPGHEVTALLCNHQSADPCSHWIISPNSPARTCRGGGGCAKSPPGYMWLAGTLRDDPSCAASNPGFASPALLDKPRWRLMLTA